jgi:hypothetical protein
VKLRLDPRGCSETPSPPISPGNTVSGTEDQSCTKSDHRGSVKRKEGLATGGLGVARPKKGSVDLDGGTAALVEHDR